MDSTDLVFLTKTELLEILKELNVIVVSLDRIGSYHSEISEQESNKIISDFINNWDVFRKLANIRRILDAKLNEHINTVTREKLDEEFEALEYWSLHSMKNNNTQ